MTLPDPVAALLARAVEVGERAQAFPLLTVDTAGFPHVALLSATELGISRHGAVLAALAGTTTRANLLRTRQATLVAVEGHTAHTLKLQVVRAVECEGVLGVVFEVAGHKADSLGIALSPLGFVATEELATLEQWDRSKRVLAGLEDALGS